MMHTKLTSGTVALFFACTASAGTQLVSLCEDTDQAIPDSGMVQIVLDGPAGSTDIVQSATLDLALAHPWVGDLVITLEHAGQSVVLVSQLDLVNWPYACGGDNIDATFEDAGAQTLDSLCSNTVVPVIGGSVQPEESLSAFQGAQATGQWILTISDVQAFDAGTFDSVCLRLQTAPFACDADVDGNGTVDVNDIAYVIFRLGDSGTPGTVQGDADASGQVDVNDVAFVIFRLGNC